MKLTCLRHGLTPLNAAHRFNGTIQEGITAEQRTTLMDIFGGENASLTSFMVEWPDVLLESYSAPLTSAAA